jgi:hypothetical protein
MRGHPSYQDRFQMHQDSKIVRDFSFISGLAAILLKIFKCHSTYSHTSTINAPKNGA